MWFRLRGSSTSRRHRVKKLLTLKVAHREGELLDSNNQISTFVTVLTGGLNVMFLQGPNISWDYKYLMRSIASSPDIQVEGVVIKSPIQGGVGSLDDAEFAPGRYNVYILSDLRADFLTPKQHSLLADAVRKGAGLMMLGGRNSFGPGGWARHAACRYPSGKHPPRRWASSTPKVASSSYRPLAGSTRPSFRSVPTALETERIWNELNPVLGTQSFWRAQTECRDPGRDLTQRRTTLGRGRCGRRSVHSLRRRYLGVGPLIRRGPERPPQVLEASHFFGSRRKRMTETTTSS